MKKHVLLAKMLMVMAFTGVLTWGSLSSVYAQASAYSFSQSNGTYSPITGTSFLVNSDDGNSLQNIGFTFNFAGNNFTQFMVNSNGNIRLGTANPTGQYTPISTATNTNALSPFGRDGRSLGGVIVQTQGSAPNRVCVIQYDNYQVQYNVAGELIDMQIRLYETTNVIEFIYADAVPGLTDRTCQVGIRGTNATSDFNNRTTTTNWNASTAGAANNNTMAFSTAVTMPVNGLTFTWTPPSPCVGTPNPGNTLSSVGSACSAVAFTLSLQNATSGTGVTYQWQTSPDGSNWTNAGPNAATWTTSQTAATHYRCVVTCSGNDGTSTALLVNMNPPNQCYCTPAYTSGTSAGDLISAVSISGTTLNNNVGFTAGQPSYLNFYNSVLANQTGTLNAGSSYTVTISTGEWGDQGVAAWIDFNQNGVFDSNEKIGTSATVIGTGFTPGFVNATASFTVSLPCNPTPGDYRMRIRGVYFQNGPLIDPCNSQTWGQAHDYKVTIAPPPPCPSITGLSAGTPGSFNVVLNWNQGCAESAWNVEYGSVGFTPGTGTTVPAGTNVNFDLTGLASSTNYDVYVSANCGVDGTSTAFGPIAITTDIAPCSGTPTQSNTLSSSPTACLAQDFTLSMNQSYNDLQIVYQWQSSADNISWNNIMGATNPTLVTQQAADTWYRCLVTCNASSQTMTSTATQVTMGLPTQCYCTPVYSVGKTDGDLISQVQVTGTTLNNNSGTAPVNPAYTYFNTLPEHTGDLQAGTTYNINVTYGSFTAQQCAVWIDFNENGVFELSERVGFTTSNSTAGFQTVSFPISLPCNPTPGVKRMRVRNVYFTNGNTIDPCATYAFGETEDYDVTILPPPACPSITGLAAGTPGSFNVVLNWNQGCAESAWNVEYGPVGFTPGTGTTVPAGTNVNFDLTGLASSTNYHIYVSADCGVDGNSTPFGPVSVTTTIAPCSGTPIQSATVSTAPNACIGVNFTLSMNQTYNDLQIVYQWQSSADNISWNDIMGATNPTHVQNQAVATWYRCLVTCNASSQTMTSTAIQVNMSAPNQCYCEAQYSSGKTAGDLISNVEIPGTTLANNSGTAQVNPAYTYFTGPSNTADLIQGGNYNITISVGTWGNQHLRAWIDYNDNGIFEDSESIGNTIIASGQGNTGPFPPAVFNVSLSNSAPLGTHRMRIRDVWQSVANPAFAATIDPCISYSFGETEDYDITIVAPVTTQLRAIDCGATNVTMNQILRAIQVGAPNYRFRVSGANNGGPGWNNNQFIYDTPNGQNHFRFQFIPGSAWGATYAVEVAVGDGFGNYGPYGNSCNVTLENQTTTQIVSATCGATVTMDNFVQADWAPGAVGYRFRIQGANNGGAGWSGNTFIYETTAPVRSFKFNNHIPGALFGETYSIDVAVLSGDNVWLPYGSACNVTIATPSTQIQASQCGITGVALSTSVLADNVVGASGYRFRITGANSTSWVNSQFILNRPNRVMQFQMVAGVLPGEIYQVEVAVMDANGNYGAYGSSCNVTLEGTPSIVINDESEIFMADKSLVEVAFGANASHNPFTTEFGIQVLNANDSETINVVIYDMSGKLIERNAVNPMDIEAAKFGSNLASGMYMIEVRQGSNQAVIRQVKN